MVDREKVFDALRNCITEPKCKDCPWEDCEKTGHKRVTVPVTLLLDVLKLLKEPEPVKVIIHDEDEWYGFYAQCPECACEWMMDHEKLKYCPHCGKVVKWE